MPLTHLGMANENRFAACEAQDPERRHDKLIVNGLSAVATVNSTAHIVGNVRRHDSGSFPRHTHGITNEPAQTPHCNDFALSLALLMTSHLHSR